MYYPNQSENVYYETVIPNTNLGMKGKDQTLVGLRAPTAGNLGSPYRLGLYRMGYWIDAFHYLPGQRQSPLARRRVQHRDLCPRP